MKCNKYMLTMLIFFIDVMVVVFFKRYVLCALIGLLIAFAFKKHNNSVIGFSLMLLCFESFLKYGRFAFNLGPLILLIATIYKTKKILINPNLLASIYFLIFLIIQSLVFDIHLLKISVSLPAAIFNFIANIIIFNIIIRYIAPISETF